MGGRHEHGIRRHLQKFLIVVDAGPDPAVVFVKHHPGHFSVVVVHLVHLSIEHQLRNEFVPVPANPLQDGRVSEEDELVYQVLILAVTWTQWL